MLREVDQLNTDRCPEVGEALNAITSARSGIARTAAPGAERQRRMSVRQLILTLSGVGFSTFCERQPRQPQRQGGLSS